MAFFMLLLKLLLMCRRQFVAVVVVDVVMVFAQADSEAFQCNLQHKLRDLPEKM